MDRKEAIEVIKKNWPEGRHQLSAALETLIPELAESEDEKIRKMLIGFFSKGAHFNSSTNGIADRDILAWLEKQGKEKEVNLVEILKHYPRETELYSPLYGKLWLAKVDERYQIITCYKRCLHDGCTRAILEQEETVSFYSNGTTGLTDCTVSKDCMLFLYDIEKQGKQKPLSHNYDEAFDEFMSHIPEKDADGGDTCYNYDDMLSAIQFGIKWQKEQKPAEWSEDKGRHLDAKDTWCCHAAWAAVRDSERYSSEEKEHIRRFLDRCKPTPTWKPNEEQMDAVANILKFFGRLGGEGYAVDGLKSLYIDLKNLL